MIRIGVTSDLHGYLPQVPEDLSFLCICGDISPLWGQDNMPLMKEWLKGNFIPWAKDVAGRVILVAGNHDLVFERCPEAKELFLGTNVVYLENQEWESPEGLLFFGTPYCKIFGSWSFMREPESLEELYSKVPEKCDFLLSHDSPTIGNLGTIEGKKEAGNRLLDKVIAEKKPKYFFSGHIHSGNHNLITYEDTRLANVSLCNESYKNVYPIRVIEI